MNRDVAETFYDRYIEALQKLYPRAGSAADLRERLSPTLISQEVLELPVALAGSARNIVAAFFALRQSSQYREFVTTQLRNAGRPTVADPGNYSALTCFDFHSTPDGQLKLIEINTNASASLIVDLLYRVHGVPNLFSPDFRAEIADTFALEARLQGRAIKTAAIIDEEPTQQRLFIEFQMYAEIFGERGWTTDILDPRELKVQNGCLRSADREFDLVYNRHTDFYFETEALSSVAAAFRDKQATISPNAFEYMLLADKERMQDLTPFTADNGLELESRFGLSADHAAHIARALLKSHDLSSFPSPDDAWAERKKYFFKPKRSFGGKAVYRGSSISRTVFENQVLKNEYIAQEFAPAPAVKLNSSPGQPGGEFKYDLRFYTYQDRIQLACARLYQGQTTNTQTPGGGLTAIRWV
ncbi:MAG: hypothetical protein NDI61_05030 [Bdellovibrionaceae bacterium]|nr:hypothetical protein [Pseudobdellovibrionaceae bacterium]